MVKSIFLQDGEEIFVDDDDYERVNQHIWRKYFKGNTRYIHTKIGVKRKDILLTTYIQNGSFQKNKNNDFTKNNLTTKGSRSRWGKPKSNGSSKYKGVNWRKDTNKWVAKINVEGKQKHLGFFESEDMAAKSYNRAVDEFWEVMDLKTLLAMTHVKKETISPIKDLTIQEIQINMVTEVLVIIQICLLSFLLEKNIKENYIAQNTSTVEKRQL